MIGLAAFLVPFLLSYTGTLVLLRSRPRNGFVDIPNERSSHETPKPRFGGIAMMSSFLVAMGGLAWYEPAVRAYLPLVGGVTILFLTGLLDDWRGLSVRARFTAQLCAAAVVVMSGNVVDHMALPGVGVIGFGWFSLPLTVLFVIASVNFYNFVDGIDGLAAGSAFIASLFLAFIAFLIGHHNMSLVYLVTAGAAVGFLQFNFPPSRLFMGDSGSTSLGFIFAWMAIAGNRLAPEVPIFVPLLILSSLYLDAGLTLVRRIVRGERVLQAHHTHYYQRLLSLGFNHKQVTLLEYLMTAMLGASAVVYLSAGGLFPLFLALSWFAVFTAAILKIGGLERGDRLFWERRALFVIGTDVLLIAAAYVGAYFLRLNFHFTQAEGNAMLRALPIVLVVRTAVFFKYGLYRGVWKYTSVSDVVRVIKAVTTGSVIILTAVVLLYRFVAFPRTLFIIEYFLLITFILGARFSYRLFHEIGKEAHGASVVRYGIIGAGDYGERLAREIKSREGGNAVIACFVDDDPSKIGLVVHGAPISGPILNLPSLCETYRVDALVLGIRKPDDATLARVLAAAESTRVSLVSGVGGMGTMMEPSALVLSRVAYLAGREARTLGDEARRGLSGRRVLVTHGGDRIGTEIASVLMAAGSAVSVQFDNARERDAAAAGGHFDDAVTRLGPIETATDADALLEAAAPDVVIHCVAADVRADDGTDTYLWRHVVSTTEAMARAAARRGVHRFVLVPVWGKVVTGTDAANTAALAEACMLSIDRASTRFASLRLPRVLSARAIAATDEGDEFDLTEHEAATVVANVAGESSQGIFVANWRGTIPGQLVIDAARGERIGRARDEASGVALRSGPLFPAEQDHASAVDRVRRVSGPLYPANDVFRKVLAGMPVRPSDDERSEWMRLIAGQLYHIVPMGAAVPGLDGGRR